MACRIVGGDADATQGVFVALVGTPTLRRACSERRRLADDHHGV
ncbi:MAG: hypothetical protein ABDI19_12270 [Armatimonadota bacterium]